MDNIIYFLFKYWSEIVATLALLISIINIIINFILNYKNLDIKINFYLEHKFNNKFFIELNTILINKSKQPISIVDIKFENNNKIYSAKNEKSVISQKKSSDEEIKIYNSELPINLIGLESSKEMFLFKLDDCLEKSEISLTINTNRGKINKKINLSDKKITIQDYLRNLF